MIKETSHLKVRYLYKKLAIFVYGNLRRKYSDLNYKSKSTFQCEDLSFNILQRFSWSCRLLVNLTDGGGVGSTLLIVGFVKLTYPKRAKFKPKMNMNNWLQFCQGHNCYKSKIMTAMTYNYWLYQFNLCLNCINHLELCTGK